jgi:class 3 adenylate cyclase
VAEVLESWGGTAGRLVGGSVLAVFGVPTAHEDDAGRALRAGLELLERSPMPPSSSVRRSGSRSAVAWSCAHAASLAWRAAHRPASRGCRAR